MSLNGLVSSLYVLYSNLGLLKPKGRGFGLITLNHKIAEIEYYKCISSRCTNCNMKIFQRTNTERYCVVIGFKDLYRRCS